MKKHTSCSHHAGLALILSLLLLFVMTMLAVTSFSNTHIQERISSNVRLQTMAIEAAAAGASDAIGFFLDNPGSGDDQLCGGLDHEGWTAPTAWVQSGTAGDATLKQRMYCLADVYPCEVDEVDCDVRPPRSQLFVLSRESFVSFSQLSGQTLSFARIFDSSEGIVQVTDTYFAAACCFLIPAVV